MENFEWDETKNQSNQKKHKISFEDASDIFNDENRLTYESKNSEEKRFLTIGKAFQAIIAVVYTSRNLAYRIISARRARKKERIEYISKKLNQDKHD